MPEWPNGAVSKTVIQVTVSRVRIPVFPLSEEATSQLSRFFLMASTNLCLTTRRRKLDAPRHAPLRFSPQIATFGLLFLMGIL